MKIVFTKCLEDKNEKVTYDFDLIENEPPPVRGIPERISVDNAPWWLNDVTADPTEREKQDDPPSHPLALMVRKWDSRT